jgi:hypothetical protein
MAAASFAKAAVIPSNNQVTAVPRHREINEFLVRKICRDLGIPAP